MIAESWDVVVIGAGPSGAFAARQLALKQKKVLLVDKAAFPREKVCGGCLNQHAVQILEKAGLEKILTGVPLQEFMLAAFGRQVSWRLPGGQSLSRKTLDAALVAEAQEAGVVFLDRTKVEVGGIYGSYREVVILRPKAEESQNKILRGVYTEILRFAQDDDRRSAQDDKQRILLAKAVLVCDGLAGSALPGHEWKSKVEKASRFGVGAILDPQAADSYAPGCIYMACARGGYAGLVRLEDGRINVAAAFDFPESIAPPDFDAEVSRVFEEAGLPRLKMENRTAWHGAPALTRSRKTVAGERLLILGDAAGYSEPFTGEGISWALDSALEASDMLTEKCESWGKGFESRWQNWYDSRIKWRRFVSQQVTRGLRNPLLLRGAMNVLGMLPGLAQPWINLVCEQRRVPGEI